MRQPTFTTQATQHTTHNAPAFSLLEVMVAVTVFGLIMTSAAGTFAAIQQAWRKQKNSIDLVQNSRWALESMANEIRQGGAPLTITGGGERLSFRPYPGPPTALVWYWRGNTASDLLGLGDRTFFYRGVGATIGAAYLVRQQLANFIVVNPSGNPIFTNAGGGLYTIELTLRPQPTLAIGSDNRNYTLTTQVRVRN